MRKIKIKLECSFDSWPLTFFLLCNLAYQSDYSRRWNLILLTLDMVDVHLFDIGRGKIY
jgi:hypothetical protein